MCHSVCLNIVLAAALVCASALLGRGEISYQVIFEFPAKVNSGSSFEIGVKYCVCYLYTRECLYVGDVYMSSGTHHLMIDL